MSIEIAKECCECLGASDPDVCAAFFKAMLDATLKPYMPAIDLVIGIKGALIDPLKIPELPSIALKIPTTAVDIFGWSPDLPPVSLSVPGLGDVSLPGASIPGFTPEMSIPLAGFFVDCAMIPIKPVLDLALDPMGAFPPDLPTLDGIAAQIPLPPAPEIDIDLSVSPLPSIPFPDPTCIAKLLMFPVDMLGAEIGMASAAEEEGEVVGEATEDGTETEITYVDDDNLDT